MVSGGLALAGLLVLRGSGLDLTHGAALALVCVSGAAGLATLVLCGSSRFGLARLTAALAVAAVVVGWAAAQAPRFLPGMTVTQAAAGQATLVAIVIAVAGGCVVLLPSLGLLYALFLRGRLDTPESHAPGDGLVAAPGQAESDDAAGVPAGPPGEAPLSSSPTRPEQPEQPDAQGRPRGEVRRLAATAVAGLAGGAGLLVFGNAPWATGLGVAGLLLCAVSVFTLTATPLDR